METYNQKQPATSRTLPCGSRPSSQPPLHTVLQTYRDRNWDYVPKRSVPELSSDVTGVVQGYFFGMDGREIPFEVVLELLKKDASIIGALGGLPGDEEQRLKYLETALRKVEEGRDMQVDPNQESKMYRILVDKVTYFLKLVKREKSQDPSQAALLKINRLAGSLQKRAGMFGDLGEISFGLEEFIRIRKSSLIERIHSTAMDLLLGFKGTIGGGQTQGQWFLFESLSLFGPLFNALSILREEFKSPAERVSAELREIRQLMETNPAGISVVAHRGMGPTNRSMGGLIGQDDPRRLNRPAENSREAFTEAMESARYGELDGVECDVFLSADRVPILSHEEKVREQLSEAVQAQYASPSLTEASRIGDLDEGMLLGLRRTTSPDSGFMTLEGLLDMATPVAIDHYTRTGKPFRVEVEMKGTKIGTKDPGLAEQNVKEMEFRVARVISQFKKRRPDAPIEILLFNGNVDEVQGYARKRREKTALGSIYTGFNAKTDAAKGAADLWRLGLDTDELRYMMHDDPGFQFTKGHQRNFITTLVYGVETAPSNWVDKERQPTGIVNLSSGRMTYPNPFEDFLTLITLFETDLTRGLNKIHFLTDYAGKAPYLKGQLSFEAPCPSFEDFCPFKEADIQGVFNVFSVIANNIEANLIGTKAVTLDKEHQADRRGKEHTPDMIAQIVSGYDKDIRTALDRIGRFFPKNPFVQKLITGAKCRLDALKEVIPNINLHFVDEEPAQPPSQKRKRKKKAAKPPAKTGGAQG